jgi:UDP-glucose 4-epimerase
MKKILFLGGNGFLGKNVTEWYFQKHAIKEALFFIITGRSIAPPMLLPKEGAIYIPLDIVDKMALRSIFEKHKIDEVFHFTSATIPSNSNANISNDIQTNLLGTIRLLELMIEFNTKRITYISSGGAIYGDDIKGGAQEDDFNNPNNSYGIVKLTIEKYICLFHKLYGINYLILRLSNPFGPYHTNNNNGIVNIALRKGLKAEAVKIWGDGKNTKDYIYSVDFARIYWDLREKDVMNRILNIGSGKLYSVIAILENIKKILPTLQWDFEDAKSFDTRKVEFKLDSLHEITSLENTDFLTALRETLHWELSQIDKTNA